MDVCVFCGQAVSPAAADRDLVWVDESGLLECSADGGVGPHYPGRESDLFWRGSSVIDLTGTEPTVVVRPRRIPAA
jgi:hypothetical protein